MQLTKDKIFYKTLLTLALPIALQNLITFSISFSDNIMISSLGDSAVSGIYMASQVQMLLQFFSGGIEGAILLLSSQYWGEHDCESIRKIVSIGLRISLFFGLIINALCAAIPRFVLSLFTNKSDIINAGADYLRIIAFSFVFFCLTQSLISAMRSVESAKIGLYVSGVSLVINVALNSVLIFGSLGFPRLGTLGAGISTLIARIIEFLTIIIYISRVDKKLELKICNLLKLDKELFLDFIKYGAPILAGQLVWAINNLASSAIMGRQSESGVVAGLSIANTLFSLSYVAVNGLSNAVGIITGKTIGKGRAEDMKSYAKSVQIIFIALGILISLIVSLAKGSFISFYGVSDSARAIADSLINVIAVISLGSCYQVACFFGLIKSGGDVKFVFFTDLIFVFGIIIPSAIIATRLGAPPFIVFSCLKCDQILKCFIAAVKVNKFNWMKKLTRNEKPA